MPLETFAMHYLTFKVEINAKKRFNTYLHTFFILMYYPNVSAKFHYFVCYDSKAICFKNKDF